MLPVLSNAAVTGPPPLKFPPLLRLDANTRAEPAGFSTARLTPGCEETGLTVSKLKIPTNARFPVESTAMPVARPLFTPRNVE